MHLLFVIALTRKIAVLVKYRVSVSYDDLLLSSLHVTSYKRPSVCPDLVKNFSMNIEALLSDLSSGSVQGIAKSGICELTISPWISKLTDTE